MMIFRGTLKSLEYSLTTLGESLLIPMECLVEWILGNRLAIRKAREFYDKKDLKKLK